MADADAKVWLKQAHEDSKAAKMLATASQWSLGIYSSLQSMEKAAKALTLHPATYEVLEQLTYADLNKLTYAQMQGDAPVPKSHAPISVDTALTNAKLFDQQLVNEISALNPKWLDQNSRYPWTEDSRSSIGGGYRWQGKAPSELWTEADFRHVEAIADKVLARADELIGT